MLGSEIDGKKVCGKEAVLETNPDVVIMGILTGYEEAVAYLLGKGFPEERIITKHVDLNTRARIEALERAAQILCEKHVEGVVAELGVYRGDFAKEMNRVFRGRQLYLFDTFEGFPENSLQYEEQSGLLRNKVGQFSDTSVQLVLSRMKHPELCVVRKGLFPESAKGLQETRYAFVNIDADLYQPVLDGLEYFWPRMSEGGYIFVHDYFSMSYEGSKKAIDEFSEGHD